MTARPSWDACDVLVAGAGVAGSTVALLLARAGWKVVLADPLRPVPETGESLAAEARLLLHTLGLWDLFLRTQPLPILSKRGHWGTHSFEQSGIYSPYGLGWIVRKGRLLDELRGGARAAGAATAFGWSVVDAAPDGAGFAVRLAGIDDTDLESLDLLEAVDQFLAYFRGLVGAVAEILARALVDDNGGHRRQRFALLAGEGRIGEREQDQRQRRHAHRGAPRAADREHHRDHDDRRERDP